MSFYTMEDRRKNHVVGECDKMKCLSGVSDFMDIACEEQLTNQKMHSILRLILRHSLLCWWHRNRKTDEASTACDSEHQRSAFI